MDKSMVEQFKGLKGHVICFDIDGVVTDHKGLKALIQEYYGYFDYFKHMTDYEVYDSFVNNGFTKNMSESEVKKLKKDIQTMFKRMINEFSITEGFIEYYNLMKENNKVLFISARKQKDIQKTINYFKLHNIEVDSNDIIHTGSSEGKFKEFEKHHVTVLFEDKQETVTKYIETYPENLVCLIKTPYNRTQKEHKTLIELDDFKSLL